MASNVKAQSVLEKISVHHLECSICTNRFRQPKLLDCLHTFCLQCLHELRQSQDPSSTKLACPLCRQDTILKGSGVADLQNNFAFSALVEEVTTQEQLLKGQGSEIKCEACDEENQVVSRCVDCEHFLCQECQKAHQRMTKMKSHQIYTLAQLQSGEIVYRSKLREEVPKCGKHPDQNLNVYCNSCEQVICTTCSVLNHGKHSLVDLPEAFEKSKRKVEELISKVNERKTELKTAIEKTCKTRKKLDTRFASTNRKISKRADQEIARFSARIRQEEQKLLKESGRIYQERVKALEASEATDRKELTTKEHKLEEVTQLMQQASCSVVLELEQKLLHNLSELTEKQIEQEQDHDELGFMDFEEGERSLGRLVLEAEPKAAAKPSARPGRSPVKGKWELKVKQESGCATQVVALSDKILRLNKFAGRASLSTATIPQSPQEQSFLQKLHINDLTDDVRCIAVSKDDKLLVLDGPVVKVFNKQHQLLHQFTPGRGSDKPTCLAVDDSNLIAVVYKDKKEISLHNLDGPLIRRLPAPGIGLYLTMYNQRLIYTSGKQKRLVCIDYYGDSIFSVDTRPGGGIGLKGPCGLCYESNGSIYVAVSRGHTGEILHYSPDGKYIGCVIRGCGRPNDITFTSHGDLAVGTDESVLIYHRV